MARDGRKCYGGTRNSEAITNRKGYIYTCTRWEEGGRPYFLLLFCVCVCVCDYSPLFPIYFGDWIPRDVKRLLSLSFGQILSLSLPFRAFIRFVSALFFDLIFFFFFRRRRYTTGSKRINATSFAPSASPDWIIVVDRAPLHNYCAYKSSFSFSLFFLKIFQQHQPLPSFSSLMFIRLRQGQKKEQQ
jgi:hypothetical protein